jgi:uncharacterized phiE125 gp8 family phage protein
MKPRKTLHWHDEFPFAFDITPIAMAMMEDTKAHLRIDFDDHDLLLKHYLVVALQEAERITNRALITQDVHLLLDEWETPIYVPIAPVQSVLSIQYFDSANVLQVISPTLYEVDMHTKDYPRIQPIHGTVWPESYPRPECIGIELQVGYGDTYDTIPAAIRLWVMAAVGEMYKNPEITISAKTQGETFSHFMNGLLDKYLLPTSHAS